MKNIASFLNNYDIKLQIGNQTIIPDERLELSIRNAIQLNNDLHLKDQSDAELNPKLISEQKVFAFIEGLAHIEKSQLEQMSNKTINLSYTKLYLKDCSALSLDSNSKYKLDFKVSNSPFIRAKIQTNFNKDEAIRLLEKSKKEAQTLNSKVLALEESKELSSEDKNSLKSTQVQRYYAALVYKMNADILYNELQIENYENDVKDASNLVDSYTVLTNSGMMVPPNR